MSACIYVWELKHNILFIQFLHCTAINTLQLFFNEDACTTLFNADRGDIYAIPGQPQQFSHSQGTRECKIDCQSQEVIVTKFQSLQQCFSGPDFSFLGFYFWQCGVFHWIASHKLPFHCLIKCIAKNSVNFFDSVRSYKLCSCLHILRRVSLYFKQISIVLVHNSGTHILQLHVTDDWANIIG